MLYEHEVSRETFTELTVLTVARPLRDTHTLEFSVVFRLFD